MHIILKGLLIAANLIAPLCSIAQEFEYVPQNGTTIVFAPTNPDYKYRPEGYDCFYEVNDKKPLTFKKHFQTDTNVTPFEEIDSFSFDVLNVIEKPVTKDRTRLVLHLKRVEDGREVYMVIPRFYDKKSNILTSSLCVYRNISGSPTIKQQQKETSKNIDINIPFLYKKDLERDKEQYVGKKLLLIKRKFEQEPWKRLIPIFNYLQKKFGSESILTSDNTKLKTIETPFLLKEIAFCAKDSDITHLQPVCHFKYSYISGVKDYIQNKDVYIPYTGFLGNLGKGNIKTNVRNQNETTNFLSNCFDNWDELYNNYVSFYKESDGYDIDSLCNSYIGKKLYSKGRSWNASNNPFMKGEDFVCVDVVSTRTSTMAHFDFHFLMHGKSTRNKVETLFYNKGVSELNKDFMSEEEHDEIEEKERQERQEKERLNEAEYQEIVKIYGKEMADRIGIGERKCGRLLVLTKLYGKKNAPKIYDGKIEIGWTESMCMSSWGFPEDENTSVGSWGVHKQYVYERNGRRSYLYFENGRLTTIQY